MIPVLEICCPDIDSVMAARDGGADRVELCCALELGGLTPSAATIAKAVEIMPEGVNVLIRPRSGDFIYSSAEGDIMVDDILRAVDAGVHGIVTGALTEDGLVDTRLCRRLVKAAAGIPLTFHRAFDQSAETAETVDEIADLGFSYLLTSGQDATALDGAGTLNLLNSNNRLTIIAAGGINPLTLPRLLDLTDISEFHASAKHTVRSRGRFMRDDVYMGSPDNDDTAHLSADVEIIRRLYKILHNSLT